MTTSDYTPPVSKLLTLGDARKMPTWPNYREMGLGPEHVPDLIRMALDEELNWGYSDSDEVWAPLHAWRALGQLQAEEAAEPLTELLAWIDEYGDDWVAEEMPIVFGLIGPAAIPILADYLNDDEHSLFARIAAAHGLKEIVDRYPQSRDDCVAALMETLERFEEFDPDLNGFLISFLVEMEAVEAAPLMERAFAAEQVELNIRGDWEEIQAELGLIERESDLAWDLAEIDKRKAQRHLDELGRNDPCWCGSGKKYKYCHLRDDQQTVRG
jgi:HEAT repeat protein